MVLHTNNLLNETTLYLGRKTKGGIKASVELTFEIYEKVYDAELEELINSAPKFRKKLG